MRQDSIMFIADNEESLYMDKTDLYDKWVGEGEDWDEKDARKEARRLVENFRQKIESMEWFRDLDEPYSDSDVREAVDEVIEEFEEYREYALKKAVEFAAKPILTELPPMTPGEVAHAEKYDALARKIGIDLLRDLIPASPEQIRKALQKGDFHLNTIKLRKWDAAGDQIPGKQRLSIAERTSVLKHVATWHYA